MTLNPDVLNNMDNDDKWTLIKIMMFIWIRSEDHTVNTYDGETNIELTNSHSTVWATRPVLWANPGKAMPDYGPG